MGWWHWMLRWAEGVDLETLANRLVKNSQEAVWQRVQSRIVDMSLAEARGYVRARSVGIIETGVGSLSTGYALSHDEIEQLAEMCMERLTKWAISESLEASRKRRYSQRRLAA